MDQYQERVVFLVNKLFQAMQAGKGSQGNEEMPPGLVDCTRSHFRKEKRFHASPEVPGFLGLQERALGSYRDHAVELEEGRLTLGLDTSRFINDWLGAQMPGIEKRLKEYLPRKGVLRESRGIFFPEKRYN